MATILPPNLDQSQFAAALADFRLIVGDEWVFSASEDVALYRDAYSPAWDTEDELLASAAVAPKSVEEVQDIVRAANRHRVPLFPISTGKNLGYGGSAPSMRGSVIVDLKRMNRILEVDDKRNFCVVEPGVSYFDLYDHIEQHGLNVMLDIPDPGWGSPLGNALDHGVGYTLGIYRDHFLAHCGMEVVLPDGELMRTGMGAVPGAQTFAENRYGFGAYVDGLFAQANFGIVTKMGFWLMPKPKHFLICEVTVPRYRDIEALVDEVNHLEDQFLIGYPRYFSPLDPVTIAINADGPADPELLKIHQMQGGATVEALEAYARPKRIPFWGITLHFYGPKETVEANWAYAQRRLSAIAGAKFRIEESFALPLRDEEKERYRHKVTLGIPNLSIFSMVARSSITPEPYDGHVSFTAIIPRSAKSLFEAHEVFRAAVADLGLPPILGVFSPPLTWNYRTWLLAVPFYTSRSDKQLNAKVRESYARLLEVAAKHGWTEYRTSPVFQDIVARSYSFNDNQLLRFQTALKDAVDPNGILAPGRGGIWPRAYRKEGVR